MVMPLPVVLLLVSVQVGALAVGFLGPPGGRVRPALMLLLLGSGIVLLPLGFVEVLIGQPETGTLMVWAGVILFAASARLVRAPRHGEDEDEDGGGGGGPEPPPPEPRGPAFDWDDFDRHREQWESDRTPTPS